MNKRKSTIVNIGSLSIGGPYPIVLQSMTTTDTRNVKDTVAQIRLLENAGCQVVRVAVPDVAAAEAIGAIKKQINIPLVADIHFDYNLALIAMQQGTDKLRINPGNIGSRERVQMVTEMAKEKNIPIRIGVNAGSLDHRIQARYGNATAEALVESALEHVKILEADKFDQIVLSLKASSLKVMVEAYRQISSKVPYPLHLGVTEAGNRETGTLKSAIGIGALLLDGIGDTIRVSLTADPVLEIEAGKNILRVLGLLKDRIQIISCPTCGRCQINLIELAQQIENKLISKDKNLTVAIMGCAVNGPGEAREADIGIAGGKECALLFKKGKVIRKIPENRIVEELLEEIENL
ncbi:flavodoxin-dependent (E)-4-hydroxy-3-methylbut-2-enyl-diphosphate synthase [Anoxynatronum buryatiense]|uniref:4-hydroxy-3-methylbut-2-en-1-yl diphosphate synthase (flavodoxin) n=1 Tax=Anoxynatronum buryatiense TaxID=489973 RepID=A0AA45WUE2_9CLOT|nr:4-hydroxy-3-methylbut-2-en-1-yl diphosphate synthase [Anoxynatronum buryatiense]